MAAEEFADILGLPTRDTLGSSVLRAEFGSAYVPIDESPLQARGRTQVEAVAGLTSELERQM